MRYAALLCLALSVSACKNPATLPTRPSPTAARLELVAAPAFVLRSGSDATIHATVTAADGTRIPDQAVELSTTSGTLSTTTGQTNSIGQLTVRLTGADAATVRASAAGVNAATDLSAMAPFTVAVAPTQTPVIVGTRELAVTVTPAAGAANAPMPDTLTLTCASGATPTTLTVGRSVTARCAFSQAGDYVVTAIGTAANGWSTAAVLPVTVQTAPSAHAPPATPAPTLTATLTCTTATGSLTATCNISSVAYGGVSVPSNSWSDLIWDWGDATSTNSGTSHAHAYARSGSYAIRVTFTAATSDGARNGSASATVTVPKAS